MSNLIHLLSLYYVCDQAAALRAMTPSEVAQCMATYDRIKMTFVEGPPAAPGSPERVAQNRTGYRSFKAWERDNPDTVARLRRAARASLGLAPPPQDA